MNSSWVVGGGETSATEPNSFAALSANRSAFPVSLPYQISTGGTPMP
eukprot:CAMPEP_0183459964 /NCGR_PEP_ID=MMETSP0370-20130417/136641_1 /TAXON_ID=268820 /ORGANISM="Peridinium aciculiferum, Strain PAER-2" /LENGTH=46 /DNA_ID= /DNA_START= /DNA_END= /DNA_ORIENTATION=